MRTRRGKSAPGSRWSSAKRTRSFFTLLCLGIGLDELQCSRSLGPVSTAVLHQLLEADLAVGDARDHAEVLAHVVALRNLVDVALGRSHERVDLLVARQCT